jgi:hypothetical protein
MAYCEHGYGSPSLRAVGSTLPGRSPLRDGVEQEAGRPRVFLRQASRDCARDRQDKLTLRRIIQVRLGFDFGFSILDFCLQLMISNLTF